MGTATSSPVVADAMLQLRRRHVQRAELERIQAQLPELARSEPLDYVDAADTQYCGAGSQRRQERERVMQGYADYFGIAAGPACPVIHRHARVLSRMRRALRAPSLSWPDVVNKILVTDEDRELVRAAMRGRDAAQLDAAADAAVQHYLVRLARRQGGVSDLLVPKRLALDGQTRLCQVLLPSGELCPNAALLGLDLSGVLFVDCCSVCPAHLRQLATQAAQLLAQSAMDSYVWSTAVPSTGVWDLRYWIRNKDDVLFYAQLLRKIVKAARGLLSPAAPPPPPRRRR